MVKIPKCPSKAEERELGLTCRKLDRRSPLRNSADACKRKGDRFICFDPNTIGTGGYVSAPPGFMTPPVRHRPNKPRTDDMPRMDDMPPSSDDGWPWYAWAGLSLLALYALYRGARRIVRGIRQRRNIPPIDPGNTDGPRDDGADEKAAPTRANAIRTDYLREAAAQTTVGGDDEFRVEHDKTSLLMKGRQCNLYVRGMESEQEAIALAYYVLQHDVTRLTTFRDRPSTVASECFLNTAIAGTEHAELQFAERTELFGSINTMSVENLLNRVSTQLEHGYSLFDLEGIIAHVGAYMRCNDDKRMDVVVRDFMGGNFSDAQGGLHEVLADAKDDISENAVIPALLGLCDAEMSYRLAACEADIDRCKGLLKEAHTKVDDAMITLSNYSQPHELGLVPHRILDYGLIIKKRAAEGLTALRAANSCEPAGTYVPNYGPTAASVTEKFPPTSRVPSWTLKVSALTPIRAAMR